MKPKSDHFLSIKGVNMNCPGHWCAMCAALVISATFARGPLSAGADEPQQVQVVCLDLAGEPVTGAEVHLFQHSGGDDGKYVHFGPFESDMRGRVVCMKALFTRDDGSHDRFIYARVPGRVVGVGRSMKWRGNKPYNPEGEVKLAPSRSVEGSATAPPGFDITKLTVRIHVLHVHTGEGDFDYQSFPREDSFPGLDAALPEMFDRHPNAKGEFRFDDVPEHGRIYVLTRGEGLGEAQWRNEGAFFGAPIALAVAKECALAGVVLSPDGKPAPAMEIAARRSASAPGPSWYLSTFRAVTDERGRFHIRGLPETEFIVTATDPTGRWIFRPREKVGVLPEGGEELSLAMENGVKVSGRVTDPDGKPVEAAHLSAVADNRGGPGLAHDSTDADGRYELRLPAGEAHLYFNGLPDGFAYPDPQIVKALDIQAGQTDINVDITLQRQ
jgi:protocatechuate 3,4-dioxygenase beta subunit